MAVNVSPFGAVRTCVRCKVEKPLADFVRRSDRMWHSGYGAGCLKCYHAVTAELRILRRGDPKPPMPLLERFEKYYMPIHWTGCWLWMGGASTNKREKWDGCGELNMKQPDGRWKPEPAYRVAWKLFRGEIPAGKLVCHSCDVRICVNPDHLFLGTHMDNTLDMVRKGRDRFWGQPTVNRGATCQ